MIFSVVFLRPSFLNSLFTSKEGLPLKARKQGFAIAKNESGTFALEVPDDWKVIQYPLSEGYTSLLSLESKDYKVNTNSEDSFGMLGASLASGARIDISVIKSHEEYVPKPTNEITRQEPHNVGDVSGTYFVYEDAGLAQAIFHEFRFAKNGQAYLIKMTFNPQKYKDGEKLFKYILSTLVIK